MATRPLDLSQERRKGRERKGRKEGREETGEGGLMWGEESTGQLWEMNVLEKKKVETETESKESRSKGKRTYVEKKEIKPDHAIQVPSDGGSGGGGRTRQKARSTLLTFCLSE